MEFEKAQQNGQVETKAKSPQESQGKVGAALLRLQQSFPEEEVSGDVSLQDFFRELRKPRGKEYVEQVKRCIELSRRIAELREELAREKETGKQSESPEGEKHKNESGNRGGGSGQDKFSAKPDTQEQKTAPAWLPKAATSAPPRRAIEWKGTEISRIQKELDRLEWELKQQQKQLYDRLPKGDPYLTSVFWSKNEEELLRRGILSREGTPYDGVEELFQRCNATTEQEYSILSLADRALRDVPEPLVVEAYLHAVCKVFADGSTQLIRG